MGASRKALGRGELFGRSRHAGIHARKREWPRASGATPHDRTTRVSKNATDGDKMVRGRWLLRPGRISGLPYDPEHRALSAVLHDAPLSGVSMVREAGRKEGGGFRSPRILALWAWPRPFSVDSRWSKGIELGVSEFRADSLYGVVNGDYC